jgi:hypothetical protein
MNAHTNLENLEPPVTRYGFSVEEFHKLAEAGVLREDARVELIEGELIKMAPIGNRHAFAVNRLSRLISKSANDRFYLSAQNPIVLGTHSEPGRIWFWRACLTPSTLCPTPAPKTSCSSSKSPTQPSSTTAKSKFPCTLSTASRKPGSSTYLRNSLKSISSLARVVIGKF